MIPSQIHLRDDEEDTILSSDGLGGGGAGGVGSTAAVGPGVLKRVVSIEKLRGSVNLVSFVWFLPPRPSLAHLPILSIVVSFVPTFKLVSV